MRHTIPALRTACAALTLSLAAWAPMGVAAPAQGTTPDTLQNATWFAEGAVHPKHVLYAVVDPNCPFCHDLWKAAQPLYKSGVQVRYLLVGILAANSPAKAAAILEARKPAAAWDINETHWQQLPDDLGGGIAPLAHPGAKALAAIRRNEALMHALGIQGTPAVIYVDSQGRVHVAQSAPDTARLQQMAAASASHPA